LLGTYNAIAMLAPASLPQTSFAGEFKGPPAPPTRTSTRPSSSPTRPPL
jgi:hypothetical protein